MGQIPLDKDRLLFTIITIRMLYGRVRNLTQLWSIILSIIPIWVQSQLLVYKDAGWLGDGIACSKYVSGVGTNFTSFGYCSCLQLWDKGF